MSRFKLTIKTSEIEFIEPDVLTGVKIEWNRDNSPGKLEFELNISEGLTIEEGNPVKFEVDGKIFYYGYIFSLKQSSLFTIKCTAYDQLRYLKNKDTYVYTDTKYSDLVKRICNDRVLAYGTIDDTGYVIPGRIEEEKEYYEMLKTASELTTTYTGKIFELFDNAGKIELRNIENMKIKDFVIDKDVFSSFDYETSINENTFNRIKVDQVNHDSNSVVPNVLEDKETIAKWGVLQYYAQTTETDIDAKMKGLLSLLNKPTRKFSVKDCLGFAEVRAGSLIPVMFNVYNLEIKGFMLVDSVTHTFKDSYHFMDLKMFNKDILPMVKVDNIFKNEKKEKETTSGSTTGDWTSGSSIEEKIWFFYRGHGFSEAATAGLMGNIFAESGMNPSAIESNGEGHGLYQWSYERKPPFFNYAKNQGKSWQDLGVQLDYSIVEMNGIELWSFGGKSGLERYKNYTSPTDAAIFICKNYERAGIERMSVRTSMATKYYNQFKGKTVPMSSTGGMSGKRAAFIKACQEYIGVPYLLGAHSKSSIDCTGLVSVGMRALGLFKPGERTSTHPFAMMSDNRFESIPKSQLRPGDILHVHIEGGAQHVAIFMGGNQTLEATPPRCGYYTVDRNRWQNYYKIRGIDD